jgi:hypothetical protein
LALLLVGHTRAEASSVDSLRTVMTALETLHKTGKLDSNGKLNLGRVYFYLAVDDKEILEKGEKHFKLMGNERKAESAAYLAALEAIRAKNALWPMDKWTIANSALAKMDQVVEANPENIEVRFIRASTCYYLPFFFNRKDQVKSDFILLAHLIPVGYTSYPSHLIRNISSFILKSNYLPEKNAVSLRQFLAGNSRLPLNKISFQE